MSNFSLSALGNDRPGVVAAISTVLAQHGVNIEDSRMATLRGRFAMMLVLSASESIDPTALSNELEQIGKQLGLESVSLVELSQLENPSAPAPSHVVTVYGGDHPGIVSAIAETLAERLVNITDLSTKLVGESSNPLYVMVLEVKLPESVDPRDLQQALVQAASQQSVEVTLRELDNDVL